MRNVIIVFCFLLGLDSQSEVCAQIKLNKPSNTTRTWVKESFRTIYIGDTGHESISRSFHQSYTPPDTFVGMHKDSLITIHPKLVTTFIYAECFKKIRAYGKYNLTDTLGYEEFMEHLNPESDVDWVEDIDGSPEHPKSLFFQGELINGVDYYCLFSYWHFDWMNGRAMLEQPVSISPQCWLSYDGGIRINYPLFWLNYSEVKPIIDYYSFKKPGVHFDSNSFMKIRPGFIQLEDNSDYTSRLEPEEKAAYRCNDSEKYNDSLLGALIMKYAWKDKISVYNVHDVGLKHPVKHSKVKRLLTPDAITQYSVLQKQFVDPETQNVTVQIVAIAPVLNVSKTNKSLHGNVPLFWLKFADLKRIVNDYELTNPGANLDFGIMKNYFLQKLF